MQELKTTTDKFHTLLKKNGVTPYVLRRFKKIVYDHYHTHGRDFVWRTDTSPYSILVSEIMLQQTQTSRVAEKYKEWMSVFPDFATLAAAPLKKVLNIWQGLGYNRRAIALHTCAKRILGEFHGVLPKTTEELVQLPHVGPNTAASIAAFAYNTPTVFIETNIRSVFIHFFFKNKKNVDDKKILELVAKTLDKKNPREWYYALMDYGVLIKKMYGNPNKKSKQYNKQSAFVGSNRQIRGAIVRILTKMQPLSRTQIKKELEKAEIPAKNIESINKNLISLASEGFIIKKKHLYYIP